MSEAELQKAVLELARRLRWRIARFPATNVRDGVHMPLAHDTKGFPDVLLVRERLVAVEFKAAGKYLAKEQGQWRDWLLGAGVEWQVFYPADWLNGYVEEVLAPVRAAKKAA